MAQYDIDQDFLICNDNRCVLLAEDFIPQESAPSVSAKFNKVLADIAKVYPKAVLVGAVAAAKYVRNPNTPRETQDVDILLDEKDFAEFLVDEIPDDTSKRLEAYFETSDSINHSLKHKETGIYVDLLSTESKPIRKKISRFILDHRGDATHVLFGDDHTIDILKPELLLAMKVNRYLKNPNTEKGISDRLDIVKVVKTMAQKQIPLNHDEVKSFLNRYEKSHYDAIIKEALAA
ncbi:MAG: hypothetical protein R6U50_03300 [Desulfobacterales bacterium]